MTVLTRREGGLVTMDFFIDSNKTAPTKMRLLLLLLWTQGSLSFLAPLKPPVTVWKHGPASASSFTMRPLQTPASIQALRQKLPLTAEFKMSSSLSEFADDAAGSTLTATAAGPASSDDHAKYDWKKLWYPVQFEHNIEKGDSEPTPISIFDLEMVLFRDKDGGIKCLRDMCPHRAAKLSTGQVNDGNIECLYHGWQFSGEGECVKIPQLGKGASIPKASCAKSYPVAVREGIVYVFPSGSAEEAASVPVPCSPDDLDSDPSFTRYDFVCDLPYDHSYLVENLVDPAHIPISHDATPGGGKKENACPYIMEVCESDVNGIRGRFKEDKEGKEVWTDLSVDAPGIVRYRTNNEAKGVLFGAALHCIPTGKGKSRLMFRTYFKLPGLMIKIILALKPMWFRHLGSMTILEQDIGMITSQEDHASREGAMLGDIFFPLSTSDAFVLEYRRWLDLVGPEGMPHHIGWRTSSRGEQGNVGDESMMTTLKGARHRSAVSRYFRSVVHNKATRDALSTIRRLKTLARAACALCLSAFAIVATRAATLAASIVSPAPLYAASALSLCFFAASAVLAHFEDKFYGNFERHPRGWKP